METYWRPCELARLKLLSDLQVHKEMGVHVISPAIEDCQLDGWYLPVRETKTEKFCSDLNGDALDDYIFPKNDLKANGMNCSK